MLAALPRLHRRIHRDERGSIIVPAALLMTALLIVAGGAIDFGRAINTKSRAQGVIDSAVLTAAGAPTESEGRESFQEFLALNGLDKAKGTFKWMLQGTEVAVESSYSNALPTTLAQVFGMKSIPYKVTSSAAAPLQPSEITLKMKQAYGWFSKDVTFKVERPDGTIETIATLSYTMTDFTAFGWRGTGPTVITPSNTVSVGKYKKLWAEMVAHDKNTGIKYYYSTVNPSQSNHLFIDGVQMPLGKAVDVGALLPCGKTVEYSWEDSTDGWWVQDIFFDVSVTCVAPNPQMVHLTK